MAVDVCWGLKTLTRGGGLESRRGRDRRVERAVAELVIISVERGAALPWSL